MPLALRQRIIGAGLSRFVQAKGHTVVEVNHPNRQLRHQNEKAIRSTLRAQHAPCLADANARPKSADSSVEMTRHLKVARDTAVKSRRQAMVTLKTIIINAPAALRQTLDCIIGKMTLIRHLAALRPGPILSTTDYIEGYYNRLRLDSAFGYITPEQAERQAA